MNHENTVSNRVRGFVNSTKAKASAVGTGLITLAGSAMAQPDVAAVTTEIAAAKTAGYTVLGAMILAVLGFAAWKLLRRAA